jgi:uncharacterized protein (TIGR03437 family)
VRLAGHIPGEARAENDEGPVDPSMPMRSLTLVLKPSAEQQAALDQLLAEQQDPASPNYHHWLTPEEYADRFGLSQDDLQKVVAWLGQQNLTVTGTGRGRNWVAFRGAARDVENAFGTEIHHFRVNGEVHFSNANDPSLPADLDAVVRTVHGLNDFRMKPKSVLRRTLPGSDATARYNSTSGNHYLAPDDIAILYNIKPLLDAGVDGSGQKLVVVGQTQINLSDLQAFRSRFGLAGNDPQVTLVPNLADPGVQSDDQVEAHLDLEWTGAVARNASINYVYSENVMDAVQYAIDQNLAPVISMSYGLCEAQTSFSEAQTLRSWARQANAQGISWFAASGDAGGSDCSTSARSGGGLSVDIPAAIPEVTGVGGTTLTEGAGNYWNASNGATSASALSYIPESVWNDSAAAGEPASGGGGVSSFFTKPIWQTGAGVPNDGARDVPDVSMAASADHDGYLIWSGGKLSVVGGTSVASPVFAGITTLLNQRLVSSGRQSVPGLGNMNPQLYALAQTSPTAFHDVITGDNMVTISCGARSRGCVPGTYGYAAGAGYDLASGLGSVDANQLVNAWSGAGASTARGSAALSIMSSAPSIPVGDTFTLTATVKGQNGGTPTGAVTFFSGSTSLGSANLSGATGVATATLQVSAAQLALGASSITAQYSGDASYNAASASVTVSVTSNVTGPPSISAVSNGASFRQSFAPGMVLSVFGSNLSPAAFSAPSAPLPAQIAGVSATVNGFAAPLYYVSSSQVNLQIPYEAASATSQAVLTISNSGGSASASFNLSAAAPGIFTNQGVAVPFGSATRGQVVTLFITGAGAVNPPVGTGTAPAAQTPVANLPAPVQAVSVSVGGVNAPTTFVGIPAGLVGVVQVNYQVPQSAPVGQQNLVVSVGGVSSPPATITIR